MLRVRVRSPIALRRSPKVRIKVTVRLPISDDSVSDLIELALIASHYHNISAHVYVSCSHNFLSP